MLARNIAGVALALIIALAASGWLASKTHAQETFNLELDAAGSTSWNIAGVKPGDSGTKTIELHNAGSTNGIVYIWVSDVNDAEGANPEAETGDMGEPGELGNYLRFSINSSQLLTNISLPAAIRDFPTSVSAQRFIQIPLAAGQTVTAVWEWEFPETGAPQNDAQGDSLTFSINYSLTGSAPAAGEPPYSDGMYIDSSGYIAEAVLPLLEIDMLGAVTMVPLGSDGEFLEPVVVVDPEQKNRLEFEKGTIVTTPDGRLINRLEIKVSPKPHRPPVGMAIVGEAYDFTGYVGNTAVPAVLFSKPVKMILIYEPGQVPQNAWSLGISFYTVAMDWRELDMATGTDNPMTLSALIRYASTFAIVAKMAPAAAAPSKQEEESAIISLPVPPPTGTGLPPGPEQNRARQPSFPATDDFNGLWRQVSLGVAVAGASAMAVLGVIQRRRRVYQLHSR